MLVGKDGRICGTIGGGAVEYRCEQVALQVLQSGSSAQQDFALMIVRYELNGEIALYAANDTLERHTGSYRVIAVDASGAEKVIALGEYDEAKNGSRLIQRIPETHAPALLLIEWTENGVTSYNHFTTGTMPWSMDAWKRWSDRLDACIGKGE